ncbi:MAG: sel1 repeat family protein [Novosphingobium sp.]|nr:sel1 repeat family protein [Novosphingobium sp.]
MKPIHLLVAILLSFPGVAPGIEPDVGSALARAHALEQQLEFTEVIQTLRPFEDSGNADVEFGLANAYMNLAINGRKPDEIKAQDIQPAIDFAQRAAAHGSKEAWNLLYMIHGNGWGTPVDADKALDFLKRGVAAGDAGAKTNYAIQLYQGSELVPRDRAAACPLIDELARDPSTQVVMVYYAGLVRFLGQCGMKADKVAGVNLIEIAAEHGVRDAERDMGKNYEFGWRDAKDLKRALDWYEKAAGHGDPHSQWRIGMAWLNGELRQKDSAEAVDYFEQAAASGDANGMVDLGVMYSTGDGVAKDFDKARSLYEEAAALGSPEAYRELAVIYANGEGVVSDPVRARTLYLQAIELGSPEKPALLQAIESRASPDQISKSDKQFQRWKHARDEN